jgi:hypothetical protein
MRKLFQLVQKPLLTCLREYVKTHKAPPTFPEMVAQQRSTGKKGVLVCMSPTPFPNKLQERGGADA